MRDLILNGVTGPFLGSTATSRIGMQNALSFLPYSDWGVSNREDYNALLGGILGPTAGLGAKVSDAVGFFEQGDYTKAVERILPRGIADVVKSGRLLAEGETNRKGVQVVGQDDIGLADLFVSALGLPTKVQTDRWRTAKYKAEYGEHFKGRTAELKREYALARKAGEDVSEIRKEWRGLQAAKRRNGMKPAPMSELTRAARDWQKDEAGVVGGVTTDSGTREFVERLSRL